MHRLLKRQIERHVGKLAQVPAGWEAFLAAVDEAYAQGDADRVRQERALELSSSELMAAKDIADEANRTKSAFLANMSHELRTPLNSVIGFANILLKNKAKNLREMDISFLERIALNGKHLLGLINTVLDLSKVEAGHMELTLGWVRVDALVRDAVALLGGQVRAKGVVLIVDVPASLAPLYTDSDKVKQIIINLVANALKFTHQGSVIVRVTADAQRRPASISVIDTGIGIPKEKQKQIFEAFQQADNSTMRKYGGTGLGLTISRSFCEIMGYRIEVSSELEKGSIFSLLVHDIHAAGEPPPPPPPPEPVAGSVPFRADVAPAGWPLEGHLALVIDDESDSRILLTQYLEDAGCRVIAASSGDQGIRMAKEFRPNLITLDLMMPGRNGWVVLNEIKSTPELREIPVVIVSIVADENRASIVGAVDVLSKPINRDELRHVIARNLRTSQHRVLVVEDDPDSRLILLNGIEQAGFEARGVENGKAALETMAEFPPDLIILDLMMPVMDGMGFLSRLRHDARYAHLPVVVVTAKDLSERELTELHSSTIAVIRKGDDDELRGTLRSLLQRLAAGSGS